MTQETINHLKREFEEDQKIHKQTELEFARLREFRKRALTDHFYFFLLPKIFSQI